MAAPSTSPPAPRNDWFSALFGFAETDYDEARNWLRLHPGKEHEQPAILESLANNKQFKVGMFSTPTLAELRKQGAAAKEAASSLPGAALTVRNELGDVSAKHTQADNRYATFQVASQFNCLEFVGPSVAPEDGVTRYVSDKTQGPACSITCGPATVFRNYFALVDRDGECSEGQTRSRQLDNLSELSKVVGNVPAGRLFDVKGGYTLASNPQLRKLDAALARLAQQDKLDDARAALRIGVHSDVQVTSCKWGSQLETDPGQLVTQVFASACSVAYNQSDSRNWKNFASIVLEACYEATLWAALLNAHRHSGAHGSRQVFLTCVGGGVFGNSMDWIAQAMRRAFNQFKDCSLDVRIVTYAGQINPHLVALEEEFSASAVRIRESKQIIADVKPSGTPTPSLPKQAIVAPVKKLEDGEATPAPSKPAAKRGRGRQQPLDKSGESTPKAKSRKTETGSIATDGDAKIVTPVKEDKVEETKTELSSTDEKPSSADTTATTVAPSVEGASTAAPKLPSAALAKKGRGKGKRAAKFAVPEGPVLDASVLKEAESLGFAGALKNLAARPEIVSCGATAQAMLNALKEHDGLVNVAKHALLKA